MSERSNDQKKSGRRASWAWISIFLFFVLVISLGPVFLTGPQEISLTHFEENILARGATEKIVIINKEVANIYIRPEFALDTAFSEAMKSPLGDVKPGPHY